MHSPELQDKLEAALMLKEALKQKNSSADESAYGSSARSSNWLRWAIAASLSALAASTYLLFDSKVQVSLLEQHLSELNNPRTEVIFATVKIIRSAGGSIPDSIVVLPKTRATVLLEIELGAQSRQFDQLTLSLETKDQQTALSWPSSPRPDGHIMVSIRSEQIPIGMIWLVVTSNSGEVLERRLLEFKTSL